MSQVTIQFDTGNAAFDNGNGPEEAADILDRIARRLRECYTSGPIYDSNGNAIGEWSAKFPEEGEGE